MKKWILLLMFGLLAFAQGQQNIRSALGQLEETSRTMMLVSMVLEGVGALIFLGAAAVVYFKKLKGKEKKETLWLAAAIILGLLGLGLLAGAVMALLIYLTAPAMTQSLLAGT